MANDPYLEASGAWHTLSDDAKALLSRLWIPNATSEADKASNEKVLASFMDTVKQQRLQKAQELREVYAAQAALDQKRQQLEREIGPMSRLAIGPPEMPQARIEEVTDTPQHARRTSHMSNTYTSSNGQTSASVAGSSNGNMHTAQRNASYIQHPGQASGTGSMLYNPSLSRQGPSGEHVAVGYGSASTSGQSYSQPSQSFAYPPNVYQHAQLLAAAQQASPRTQYAPPTAHQAQLYAQRQHQQQRLAATSRTPPIPNQATAQYPANQSFSNVRPPNATPSEQVSRVATPASTGAAPRPTLRASDAPQVPSKSVTPTTTSQPTPIPSAPAAREQVLVNRPSGYLVAKPDYDNWVRTAAPGSSISMTKALTATKLPDGRILYRWKEANGHQRELTFEPGLAIKTIDSAGIPTWDWQPPRPSGQQTTPSTNGTSVTGAQSARNGAVAAGVPVTVNIPTADRSNVQPAAASTSANTTAPQLAPSRRQSNANSSTGTATRNAEAPSTPVRAGSSTSSDATLSPRAARKKTLVRDVIRMLGGKRPSEGGGEPSAKRRHVEETGSDAAVQSDARAATSSTSATPGTASANESAPAPPADPASVASNPALDSRPTQTTAPAPTAAPAYGSAPSIVAVRNDGQSTRPIRFIHVDPASKRTQPPTGVTPYDPSQLPAASQSVPPSTGAVPPRPPVVPGGPQVNPYHKMAQAWNQAQSAQRSAPSATWPAGVAHAPTQPIVSSSQPNPSTSQQSSAPLPPQAPALPQVASSSEGNQSAQAADMSHVLPAATSSTERPGPSSTPNGSAATPAPSSKVPATSSVSVSTPQPKRIDLAQKMRDSVSSKKSIASPSASFQFTPVVHSAPVRRQDSPSPRPESPTAPPPPTSSAHSSPRMSPRTPLFLTSRASTESGGEGEPITVDLDTDEEHTVTISRAKRKVLKFDSVYIKRRPKWVGRDLQRLRARSKAKGKRRQETSDEEEGPAGGGSSGSKHASTAPSDAQEEAEVSREVDLVGGSSDDGFSVDEEGDFIIPPANYNRHDPVEAGAVSLSLTRGRETPCKWDKCEVRLCSGEMLLRHLVNVHLAEEGTSCKCLWQGCTETYSSKRALSAHVENHARTPLVCAYESKSPGAHALECHLLTRNSADCDRDFKNGKLLLQHHALVHERGRGDHQLKRSMQLLKPNPDDLPCPPLPSKPLFCQHDTPPVQQYPITPQRHQTIGPKILANIYPYAKYTSLAALRRSLKQTDEYAFIKYKEKREHGIKRGTRFEDLFSAETTALFHIDKAFLVWKGDRARVQLPEPEPEGLEEDRGEGGSRDTQLLDPDQSEEKVHIADERTQAQTAAPASSLEYIDLTGDDM
ncbi:hypothetical protein EV714DRAFT_202509 [Schizophyllum commune]